MKTKFRNVKIFDEDTGQFEDGEICCDNGLIVDRKDFVADEEVDCLGALMLPNFVSGFGRVAHEVEREISDKKLIAEKTFRLYVENGYSKIVEQIDDFEIAKALSEFWLETEIVSGNLKLLDKIQKQNKKNLTSGVLVDLIFDPPDEIDKKVAFAHCHKLKIHSNFYENLTRAGEISTMFGKSPIEAAEDFGMLDEKLTSTNNVCLDKEDIVQMRDTKLCLSPKVNMYEGVGFEPVGLIATHQKDTCFAVQNLLGLDMFENMRAALFEARASMCDKEILSEKDTLLWATQKQIITPKLDEIASFLLILPKKTPKNIKNIENLVKFASTRDIIANVIAGRFIYKKF